MKPVKRSRPIWTAAAVRPIVARVPVLTYRKGSGVTFLDGADGPRHRFALLLSHRRKLRQRLPLGVGRLSHGADNKNLRLAGQL
jgi:hypothetical protein